MEPFDQPALRSPYPSGDRGYFRSIVSSLSVEDDLDVWEELDCRFSLKLFTKPADAYITAATLYSNSAQLRSTFTRLAPTQFVVTAIGPITHPTLGFRRSNEGSGVCIGKIRLGSWGAVRSYADTVATEDDISRPLHISIL